MSPWTEVKKLLNDRVRLCLKMRFMFEYVYVVYNTQGITFFVCLYLCEAVRISETVFISHSAHNIVSDMNSTILPLGMCK